MGIFGKKANREAGKAAKQAEKASKQENDAGAEEKRKLLQMSEISLWIDSYDEIFSDFDPRPYSQRALSDDFLLEAKKASRDNVSGKIELKFLVPKDKRGTADEATIKKRLREHFKKHYTVLKKQQRRIFRLGVFFITAGILLMFSASFVMFQKFENSLWINFLIILMEPAGWFFFWEGLGQVIFETKKQKPEVTFYGKMSKCDIEFLPY